MNEASFIEGRYETTDLIAHARLDEIRHRITDEALRQAEEAGKTLRAISIQPAERDRTVFDPLDQRWVVKWKATLEMSDPTRLPPSADWRMGLDERMRTHVAFAESYAQSFNHGAPGHLDLLTIALLAELIDRADRELRGAIK